MPHPSEGVYTLCATCHRAIFSWLTPPLFPDLSLAEGVEWTHVVAAKYGPCGAHAAVPMRFALPLD